MKEDYYKYEDYSLKLSFEKLEYNDFSLDLLSFGEKKEERKRIKDKRNKKVYIKI